MSETRDNAQAKIETDLSQLARRAADEGKVIAAGWWGLAAEVLDPEIPLADAMHMRMAFFAGAQHLFVCLMSLFHDSPDESKDTSLRLLAIHEELRAFVDEFKAQCAATEGDE